MNAMRLNHLDRLWLAACCVLIGICSRPAHAELRVTPPSVRLDRPEASQQLLVDDSEEQRDVTRQVQFQVSSPAIITVDADGLIHPVSEGATTLLVRRGSAEVKVAVEVAGLNQPAPVDFVTEILPILTKARCNSGGCHGKAEGQNGFKLSLLGFDGSFDYDALIKQGRGRRISLTAPDESLLLKKATALVAHGGGRKIDINSPVYRRLLRWIETGVAFEAPEKRTIVSIEVVPANVVMQAGETRQLAVWTIDEHGQKRCATAEADFVSGAPQVADVNPRGLLQASDVPGESAVQARYLGHVAVCRVTRPRGRSGITRPPEENFIDRLVWDKLATLGIEPSEAIDDATFMRRVYFDTIGTLPTAAEARRFLADTEPAKRSRLVDELMARPEYADYWAMKWSDILRGDKLKITAQATVGLTRWLRKQFAENRPYDEMFREILTAQGPVQSDSPVAFFKAVEQPELASRSVSQLFLGVRIECAQCHHHPSERWSQEDYAGLVGFFTGVAVKRLPDGTEAIVARPGNDATHPRTGQPVPARALGAAIADFTGVSDRRAVLAAWASGPDNPFFARAIVNRLWAHYFGRGLVEPIDDLRVTNPPTNEPLMHALADHLREAHYDLRAFTRTLLQSRVYALSTAENESNRDDRQHFSHAMPKALPAEVLLDAVCQATGAPEKFEGWPLGARATQVWDNRMPSYFFRVFGRPVRATVCECERSNEPSISQALHLLNSPQINEKIAGRGGVARRLAESTMTVDQVTDEIYLGTLSRFPTAAERSLTREAWGAAGDSRRQAVEDILWAVLNTKEFLYNN